MNDAPMTEVNRKAMVRQSDAGRKLTESQFEDTWSISGILERQINKHGVFREKLSDYAYALARTERFDMVKAEEIIRDVFKERYGQTMNELREKLVTRASELDKAIGDSPLRHAHSVVERVTSEPTMPFYRVYDEEAITMASEHGITEASAKEMMKTAFAAHEGRELYDACKEVEEQRQRPAREAENPSERKSYSRKRRQSRD